MRRIKTLAVIAAIAAAFIGSAASASENDLWFFDGIGCSKGLRFMADSDVWQRANCTYGRTCANDTVRSVLIGLNVKPGTIIKVWDDSKGSGKDDWAQIEVKQAANNEPKGFNGRGGMCVRSFETHRSGADYQIYYRRVDNLDGKVSLIEIQPAPTPLKKPILGGKKR